MSTTRPFRLLAAIWLAIRSIFWVLVVPGFFGVYAPWAYLDLNTATVTWSNPRDVAGVGLSMAGVSVLLACVIEFARSGHGTLSPLDPPRRLVVSGLYRYVRNPMYLGVTALILGEALIAGTRGLVLYWLAWFAGVNVIVLAYEEPALARQFGEPYAAYRRQVGRWLPHWRPPPL